MHILHELIAYIRAPQFNIEQSPFGIRSVKNFAVIFVVTYSIKTFWLLTVNQWIRNSFQVDRSEIAQPGVNLLVFFLLVVFVYPVLEEFIFRYFLRGKPWVTVLILSLALSVALVEITKQVPFPGLVAKRIALVLSFFTPLLSGLFLYVKIRIGLEKWFTKLFPLLFYFSIASFALLHSLNFKISCNTIWLLPMLMPFVISGAALGFVRMKWGLWASVILHMSFNLVTFILDKGFSL